MDKKYAFILAFLITLIIITNTFYIKSVLSSPRIEQHQITRVIDGDTIVIDSNETIRFLNVNAPEKNEPNSNLSKIFLSQYLNKTLRFEFVEKDKYNRSLARIYSENGEYLNLLLIEKGLASKFLVDEKELKEFSEAEEKAINNELGIWKKSPLYVCLSSSIDANSEIIYLRSKCGVLSLSGLKLKDEGRKIFHLKNISLASLTIHTGIGEDNETDIFFNSKTSVLNNDRDTIYLFDSSSRLLLHHAYGYS